MKTNLIFAFCFLTIILLLSGCVNTTTKESVPSLNDYLNTVSIKSDYIVKQTRYSGSSGGDSSLNIRYNIKNEKFVSCDGNFIRSGTGGTNTINCSLENMFSAISMSDVMAKVKSFNLSNAKFIKFDDRDCFYNIHPVPNPSYYISELEAGNMLICFNNQNSIVNFAGKGGYGSREFSWSLEGFDLTPEISKLLEFTV